MCRQLGTFLTCRHPGTLLAGFASVLLVCRRLAAYPLAFALVALCCLCGGFSCLRTAARVIRLVLPAILWQFV